VASHAQVLAYLEAFADEFDVKHSIRLKTRVVNLAPMLCSNTRIRLNGGRDLPDILAKPAFQWVVTSVPVEEDGSDVQVPMPQSAAGFPVHPEHMFVRPALR
jgi:hypothetical protein